MGQEEAAGHPAGDLGGKVPDPAVGVLGHGVSLCARAVVLEFTKQGRCRFVRRSFGRGVVAGGGWVASPHLPTAAPGRVCLLAHKLRLVRPATGGG
jgi:hypothetical protein